MGTLIDFLRQRFLSSDGSFRFGALWVSIVALLVVHPFMASADIAGTFALAILMTLALLATMLVLSSRRGYRIATLLIGVPAIGLNIAMEAVDTTWLPFIEIPMMTLLFALALYTVLRHLLTTKAVSAETLHGAVCAYLLMGIVWGLIYHLLDLWDPGSFQGLDPSAEYGELLYYSFVTLTTLGYGDISPLTPEARALAILEAIMGTLYMGFIVARFVGLYSRGLRDVNS